MPVLKVNEQQFSLHPGPNRVGCGGDADIRIGGDPVLGVQAIVDITAVDQAVIRRADEGSAVRVNGLALGAEPTPLIHGDKVEIGGQDLYFSDDRKAGATRYVSIGDVAALAARPADPSRATAASGGRLVSLVDGKEYAIPPAGISIGRDAASDVVIGDNEVSRQHAEVVAGSDGYRVVVQSANGAYVNGQLVPAGATRLLARADVIRVGSEELRFYADPAPTPKAAPAAIPPTLAPIPALAHTQMTPVHGRPAIIPSLAHTTATPVSGRPARVLEPRPVLAALEVVNEGMAKGKTYDVQAPIAHIGRGPHNDITISDESVSDSHAKLQRREDGWYVIDLGSTNGSYVAGSRIGAERKLTEGMSVRFGGVKMVFRSRDGGGGDGADGARLIAAVDQRTPASVDRDSAARRQDDALQAAPRSGSPTWIWLVTLAALAALAVLFSMSR
jgi:pSer/pThr/pTyr-binding forkhead associated (FHA) protein